MKREAIYAAAERLFLSHGYEGTTMDAVAEEAGVTKQTVYRYCPSKADLFAGLISGMGEERSGFSFGNSALEEELHQFGLAFLTAHMGERNLSFFRLVMNESWKSEELRELFAKHAQSRWFDELSDFLEKRLELPDAGSIAQIFISMLLSERNRVLMGRRSPLPRDEIMTHVSLVVGIFLKGLPRDHTVK
ncbi:TetR/AcrR family transcriptional regulator [uncultured Cohaesibacter sp.]|uniref:TetR/AcrR family transcriptional regulator n=1 Tax=uncultured Cohaesibacter sp. TaxID=1002546 RepID=UPI00292EE4F0|nr:TetR/AcrR family transcriptional regulator [uncultured Cohaesibacter sp.]